MATSCSRPNATRTIWLDCPLSEFIDLNETLRRALEIVRAVARAESISMNLGKCAGAGRRSSFALAPRWEGGYQFHAGDQRNQVMPQHLLDSYDRLQPHLPKLSAPQRGPVSA